MRVLYFSALSIAIFSLTACGEKIDSLCGTSGGSCCAINYGYDANGKPSSKVMSCRPTADACLAAAQNYNGTPEYPYTPDIGSERGQCEMKIKTVAFWDNLGFTAYFANATAHRASLPAQVTASDGSVRIKSDPDYCRQICLTNDIGACPLIPLREDVVLGMLSTVIDTIETSTSTPKIITMAEVLAKFRLSPKANACNRGDVVTSNAAIVNSGLGICRTDILQATSVGNVQATLSMAQEIYGSPHVASKVALWGDETRSWVLDVQNASLKPYFSGPIQASGRTDFSRIFAQIRGSADISCSEIVPVADLQYDIKALNRSIESDSTLIRKTFKELSDYRAALRLRLPAAGVSELDSLSISAALFPYRTYVAALQKIAQSNSITTPALAPISTTRGAAIPFEKMLRAIDVYSCSTANRDTSLNSLIPLVPELDPSASNKELLDERAGIAGDIIQCKLSSQHLSERSRAAIGEFVR